MGVVADLPLTRGLGPSRFVGVTPEGLAAVAVSFINGCAVQALIDPDHFDVGEHLAAGQGIIGQLPMAA